MEDNAAIGLLLGKWKLKKSKEWHTGWLKTRFKRRRFSVRVCVTKGDV